MHERMREYQKVINNFADNILSAKLSVESDTMESEFKLFTEAEEKLDTDYNLFHEDASANLYKNFELYSLDARSYEVERGGFREIFSDIVDFSDFKCEIIEHYNDFMDNIKLAYDKWAEAIRLISDFYDDDGMLDNTISEYYATNNTLFDDQRPKYFVFPDDKQIKTFKNSMGLLASSETHTICMSIPHESLITNQVMQVQEMALSLQHFPKLLEKYIFSFEIGFRDKFEIKMQDMDWKGINEHMIWFTKLNELAFMIFFLQDHDARGYCLLGDLIAKRTRTITDNKGMYFEGTEHELVVNRLYHSCYMFLMFCHKTGFDPQPYIESMIADFKMPFEYSHVWEKYDEDIKKGINFKAMKMDKSSEE